MKIYQEFLKNNDKWKCKIFGENFNKHGKYYRLYFKDDKIDNKILKIFDSKHLICESCANMRDIKIDNGAKSIDCQFCKSKHTITNIKNVDSNNETDGDCIIF